jgi:hypothetical protein
LPREGVKSAGRALEIMEFFADCREAGVMDVARSLGYPQSSTSELLNALTSLGYLRHDERRRTFSVAGRAGVLGSSLSARAFGLGDVSGLVEEVAAATIRETHLCEMRAGNVHYLMGTSWRSPAPASLASSAVGVLFASDHLDHATCLVSQGGELAVAVSRRPKLALLLCGPSPGDEAEAMARRVREIVRRHKARNVIRASASCST